MITALAYRSARRQVLPGPGRMASETGVGKKEVRPHRRTRGPRERVKQKKENGSSVVVGVDYTATTLVLRFLGFRSGKKSRRTFLKSGRLFIKDDPAVGRAENNQRPHEAERRRPSYN